MAEEPSEAPEETQDTLTSAAEVAAEPGPQDTPETPEQQPGESDVDWEKRYKDLQSEYTRTTQEAAELRRAQEAQQVETQLVDALSTPDTQDQAIQHLVTQLGEDGAREWLEAHGFEVEDDGDEEVFRDPRVDQLIQERQQEQQNAQIQQIETQMESTLADLAKAKELELDGESRDLILDAAVSRFKDGHPDVEGVFNQWFAQREAAIKAYRQTKRNSQSTPPVPGSSGTPNPSLGNEAARLQLANEIALEAQQSQ